MHKKTLLEESYFDHDADIGIIGRGKTIEESFINAAYTMFSLMSDLSKIFPKENYYFSFNEPDIELALVIWLNSLLGYANAKNIIFSQFKLSRKNDAWLGEASGELWRLNMEHGVDIKGATLTMLSVKKTQNHWEARCIVDV